QRLQALLQALGLVDRGDRADEQELADPFEPVVQSEERFVFALRLQPPGRDQLGSLGVRPHRARAHGTSIQRGVGLAAVGKERSPELTAPGVGARVTIAAARSPWAMAARVAAAWDA